MSGDGREMQRDWIGDFRPPDSFCFNFPNFFRLLVSIKETFLGGLGKSPTTQLFTRNSAVILGSVIFGFLGFRLIGSDRAVHFPD